MSPERITVDLRLSSRTAARHRSMFGVPKSSSRPPMAVALPRSCGGRAKQAGGMALAGTVHGGGRRRAAARQDTPSRQAAAAGDTVRKVIELVSGPPQERRRIGPAGCLQRRSGSVCGWCSAFWRLISLRRTVSKRSSCRTIRSSPKSSRM